MKLFKRTLYYGAANTKWGKFQLIASEKGLLEIDFPRRSVARETAPLPAEIKRLFAQVERELVRYSRGMKLSIDKSLIDNSAWTGSRQKMFRELILIPQGELRSYGWLARKCGIPKGARAIGQSLGQNPLPILFPCHRIVSKDGSLGGFSGGIAWKRKLIDHEKQNTRRGV